MRTLSPSNRPRDLGKKPAEKGPTGLARETTRVRGRDCRTTVIPVGCVAAQGSDGRIVAIPSGAGSLEGRDGRVVVIPPRHIGVENAKGRIVPRLRW
jgi:hypothetical protein